ncbi:hypothetical protein JCM8097_006593 [Rhodosporidiobolus ruineniae]
MPVLPLPLEVVGLVVDSLEGLLAEDWPARRKNGMNVALVCRAWRSFGTSLTWRCVIVGTQQQQDELVSHFERRPHLAMNVREVKYSRVELLERPDYSIDDRISVPAVVSARLGALCNTLHSFSSDNSFVSPRPFLHALASQKKTPLLRRLIIRLHANAADVLDLLPSFSNLTSLELHLWGSGFKLPPRPEGVNEKSLLRLQLARIHVVDEHQTAARGAVLRSILQLLDPLALSFVSVTLEDDDPSPIDWLASATRLFLLQVDFAPSHDLRPTVLRVLDLVPRLPRLYTLLLGALSPDVGPPSVVSSAPVPIASILSRLRPATPLDRRRRICKVELDDGIAVEGRQEDVPLRGDSWRSSGQDFGGAVSCLLRNLSVDGGAATTAAFTRWMSAATGEWNRWEKLEDRDEDEELEGNE